MSDSTNTGNNNDNQSSVSFRASFWLVIMLVGLFIAALNFIKAESGGEETAENKKAASEAPAPVENIKTPAETPKESAPASPEASSK